MTQNHIRVEVVAEHRGRIFFLDREADCALGTSATENKSEGDGATPLGDFALRCLWFRPDRWERPQTPLPLSTISQKCGWSDDISDPHYNRYIELPHSYSHEKLWREDGLYDVFFELGYNNDPIEPGRGSAIFLHLEKNSFQPTLGCVAVDKDTMRHIIAHATERTRLIIVKNS